MATRGGAAFRHSFDGFCFRAPRATGSLGPYPTGFARDYGVSRLCLSVCIWRSDIHHYIDNLGDAGALTGPND